MLDLIQLWQNTAMKNSTHMQSSQGYSSEVQHIAINFDESTTQSSFEFQDSPQVIFIKSTSTLERADFYDELPTISMTEEENDARCMFFHQQKAIDSRLYDGDQMIITRVIYDNMSNIVYMEAKKVPYSFILSLNHKKFPAHSALYQLTLFQTGVLAPIITRDNMSILLQRTAYGLYSVPGGFLEPHQVDKRLNFYDGRNLVTETARTELKEEILGIKGTNIQRFDLTETRMSAVSLRKTDTRGINVIEFVAPSYADCHSSYLQHVVLTNAAEDAHEHTSQHEIIPLDSQKRDALLTTLLIGALRLPGASLYLPVVLSLTRLINQACCMMASPRSIPNSASVAWPLSIFMPRPTKLLSACDQKSEDDTDKEGFNLIS